MKRFIVQYASRLLAGGRGQQLVSPALAFAVCAISACKSEVPRPSETICWDLSYQHQNADCNPTSCLPKTNSVYEEPILGAGFVCTVDCSTRKTGPNSGAMAYQFWQDGVYARLIFGEGIFAGPQYTDADIKTSFESGYAIMQADDGTQSIGLELDFNATDVALISFEDGKLHLKVTGTASQGGANSPDCGYQGDPVQVSIEIKAPMEHPL